MIRHNPARKPEIICAVCYIPTPNGVDHSPFNNSFPPPNLSSKWQPDTHYHTHLQHSPRTHHPGIKRNNPGQSQTTQNDTSRLRPANGTRFTASFAQDQYSSTTGFERAGMGCTEGLYDTGWVLIDDMPFWDGRGGLG